MKKKLDQDTLVVQSNKIIEAHYQMDLDEQKLVLTAIGQIERGDKRFETFTVRAQELADLWGISPTSVYRHADEITTKLHKRILFVKDTDKQKFKKYSWLSTSEYKDGILTLCFNEKIKPLLLGLKERFTSYKLENVLKLRSTYAIRIYQLLKEYEPIGNRTIKIIKLREMLGVLANEYVPYNNFKRKIILQAQKELINTDMCFDFYEEKEGRKVVAIRFELIDKKPIIKDESVPKHLRSRTAFIKYMRTNFGNGQIFYAVREPQTNKLHSFWINEAGLLCDKDADSGGYNAKQSQTYWQWLYEIAKVNDLPCLKQGTLF